MPAAPFWGVLVLLYGILAIVAGTQMAMLAAALSCGLAGATWLALRLAGERPRRVGRATLRPAASRS